MEFLTPRHTGRTFMCFCGWKEQTTGRLCQEWCDTL